MQLKASEVDRYISNTAAYHPVILVYGPDQGVVSERISILTKKLLTGNDDPFSLLTLETEEIASDPARLADEVNTIALFGGNRVIRVKLGGNRPITKSIKAIMEEPSQNTTVLLEGGDLKKNHSVRSLIEKSRTAIAIACYADDTRSLRGLINEELKTKNTLIDQEAEDLLLSLLGENRQTTRNELRKLALYAHNKPKITIEDVETLIGDTSASITENTVDFTMTGQLSLAASSFQRSLMIGHASYQTAHALQRHLINLQVLIARVEKGLSPRETVDQARPPIHFKRKPSITTQLNLWRNEDIIKAQDYLMTAIADSRLKPGISGTIIKALITQLSNAAIRNKRRASRL